MFISGRTAVSPYAMKAYYWDSAPITGDERFSAALVSALIVRVREFISASAGDECEF